MHYRYRNFRFRRFLHREPLASSRLATVKKQRRPSYWQPDQSNRRSETLRLRTRYSIVQILHSFCGDSRKLFHILTKQALFDIDR